MTKLDECHLCCKETTMESVVVCIECYKELVATCNRLRDELKDISNEMYELVDEIRQK